MIDRELLPLALLQANEYEEIQGRTRMQKLVFLIQEEFEDAERKLPDTYTYVPYDYGPFARELYDDLDRLREQDVIKEVREEMTDGTYKYNYALTDEADDYLSQLPEKELERTRRLAKQIKSEFNHTRLPDLLDYVYSEYPEYAENSVL